MINNLIDHTCHYHQCDYFNRNNHIYQYHQDDQSNHNTYISQYNQCEYSVVQSLYQHQSIQSVRRLL